MVIVLIVGRVETIYFVEKLALFLHQQNRWMEMGGNVKWWL